MTKKKVLLIRLDKIGDLICSLPIDEASFLKNHEVHWVISKGLAFVPNHCEPKRNFLELDKNNPKLSRIQLENFIEEFQPDVAISLQAPWWVNYALWKKTIPIRVGVLSQWHSFLFLTHGVRQKRSQAIKHESDYNFDLLKKAWAVVKPKELEKINSSKTPVLKMKASLNFEDVQQKFNLPDRQYIVVHPGMAGSALNWPIENYIEWIDLFLKKYNSFKVVITGTKMDSPWVIPILEHFKNNLNIMSLHEQLSANELLCILENAKLVLAPSTGVHHLSSALGTLSMGIFSPIKVQHPTRWMARGVNVKIFSPSVPCPEQFHCIKEKCSHFNCMKKINPETVISEIPSL